MQANGSSVAPVSIQTLGFEYGTLLTGVLILSTPAVKLRSRLLGAVIAWVVPFVAQVVVL